MMIVESITLFQLLKPKEPTLPQPTQPETVKVAPKPKPKKTFYTIKQGDSLSKIGKKTRTPWKNIWAANKTLKHQDKLEPGTRLIIPSGKVRPRKLIQAPRRLVNPQSAPTTTPQIKASHTGFIALNGYELGQCTGWVAQQRYVPPGWGDASNWKYAAQSAGWTVSSTPVAGAIGWTPGHVVYVISVGNGTVTISEQNYDWNSGIRTATFPTNKYQYLY